MNTEKIAKTLKKVTEFIGVLIFVLGFVIILISMLLFAQDRMDSCSKSNTTTYCLMTQQKFIFWDMINPIKKDN